MSMLICLLEKESGSLRLLLHVLTAAVGIAIVVHGMVLLLM